MSNKFDKKVFDKSQNKILLACFTIGLIGVITVICAFAVGKGIEFKSQYDSQLEKNREVWNEWVDSVTPDEDDDFGTDPCDYYGDYYAVNDFVINKLSVTKSGVTATYFDIFTSETEQLSVQYASAEYCLETFEREEPALILYEGSMKNYDLLWISKVDGKFVLTNDSATYTQTPITLESIHNDPKDYYGAYYANNDGIISRIDINANSVKRTETDPVTKQSESLIYQYTFICDEYSDSLTEKSQDALVVYEEDITKGYTFMYLEKDEKGSYTVLDMDILYKPDVINSNSILNDPKDYYGVYYGEGQNFEILKLSVTSKNLQITVQNPMKDDVTEEFLYSYISAEYAANTYHENLPGLVAYKQTVDEPSYIFYLSKNADDSYSISSTQGIDYSMDLITFADLMDDPEDYYGLYQLSEGNTLELFEDGTATLVLNGESNYYDFFYANEDWLDLQNISYSRAIVLANRSSGDFYVFKIDNSGNMVLADQYTFYKC